MTAEICVLNRHGVAIAADSAVTIGGSKVYNSANKLFALSKYHPIGIMIYGGASFMNVPWEIIIKDFRNKIGNTSESSVMDYKDKFFDHIKTDNRLKNLNYENWLVSRTFDKILVSVLGENLDYIDGKLSNDLEKDQNFERKLQNYLQEKINDVQSKYTEIIDMNINDFKETFLEIIKEVGNKRLEFEYNMRTKQLMLELAYQVTISNYFTNGVSGIVLVGYGEDSLFPSLFSYEIDGFINGQLKYQLDKEIHIDMAPSTKRENQANSSQAAIIPFAQREMVQLFMDGIDPDFQRSIYYIIKRVLSDYGNIIKTRSEVELSDSDVLKINKLGNSLVEAIFNSINSYKTEEITTPIIDIVRILPKEELAEMAETLINLTSFKRRISIGAETVGGPIDVAVITKGDGFVWIKRKHYFDKELNHSYFKNYFGRDLDASSFER